MNKPAKIRQTLSMKNVPDTSDLIRDRADSISLLPIDEATAVPRPPALEKAYHESEFETLSDQQREEWKAEGQEAARDAAVKANSLTVPKRAAAFALECHRKVLEQARDNLLLAQQYLQFATRRQPKAKPIYLAVFIILIAGDVAGVSLAMIYMGEIPALSVMQSLAAAVAAVATGSAIGTDLRDAVLIRRRARDAGGLPEPIVWLFDGHRAGSKILRALIVLAVVVAVLIAIGVFGLRSELGSGMTGLVFAALQLAVCAGSAYNAYLYTDEIADHKEKAQKEYDRAVKTYARAAAVPAIVDRDAAQALKRSLRAEARLRGRAAALSVKAHSYAVSGRNPGTMGHGLPARVNLLEGPIEELERDLGDLQP